MIRLYLIIVLVCSNIIFIERYMKESNKNATIAEYESNRIYCVYGKKIKIGDKNESSRNSK